MSKKLPKHIAQMVEKNNLVMAIKTLANEQNITMDEAKQQIDDYETALKQNHHKNVESIVTKQHKKNLKSNSKTQPQPVKQNRNNAKNIQDLNKDLDKRLQDMGYQPPIIPYWMKRVFIILLVTALLLFLVWRLLP